MAYCRSSEILYEYIWRTALTFTLPQAKGKFSKAAQAEMKRQNAWAGKANV